MKISLNWLKEYVPISISAKEVADKLTMAGIEVKDIENIGGWEKVVVGKILEVKPHPSADRIRLTTIDLGTEQQTVVCGAPNLNVGDKIAFAYAGAELIEPDTGQKAVLKAVKIRGVLSAGMVCSEKELGISEEHTGIMVLPADAPLGMPLHDYMGDTIIDMEVTPNRGDCLSVIGIAREMAALTGQEVRLPEVGYQETAGTIEGQISVEILAPDFCPRYCASLIKELRIAPSPSWMQKRLVACGMRPINNLVDVTNYVMLEYGQPLHAFDYDRVKDKKILVRRAKPGEYIFTLDGTERKLSPDMLVIADTQRAVAVAGVMGGANTEVTEMTKSILLESANFNAASIHRTGNILGLVSEARYRYERGIRPELALLALRRATQLLIQLGGGDAVRGVIDAYPGKQERKPILLSAEKTKRVLGVDFGADGIIKVLKSLGFKCEAIASSSDVLVTAPYWRNDINLDVDLMEEVARIAGYDRIPATMLSQELPHQNPSPLIALKRKVGPFLSGCGFQEVITNTLTNLETLCKLSPQHQSTGVQPLRMANPMTADQEYLRPNLRANLLLALAANRRFEEGGIRFYEMGRIYLPKDKGLPDEHDVLCGVISGLREEKSWHGGDTPVDFYDAKGIMEGLLEYIGFNGAFKRSDDVSLHPGKQAAIVVEDSVIGVVGEVHPSVARAFDIAEVVYLFEIDMKAVMPCLAGHRMYQPVPKFPAIVRDIALVIDSGVTYGRVRQIISSFSLVEGVALFDVYSGERIGAGKRSLAYRIVYRSPDHTLTDDEVDRVQQKILNKLSEEVGASLRG